MTKKKTSSCISRMPSGGNNGIEDADGPQLEVPPPPTPSNSFMATCAEVHFALYTFPKLPLPICSTSVKLSRAIIQSERVGSSSGDDGPCALVEAPSSRFRFVWIFYRNRWAGHRRNACCMWPRWLGGDSLLGCDAIGWLLFFTAAILSAIPTT